MPDISTRFGIIISGRVSVCLMQHRSWTKQHSKVMLRLRMHIQSIQEALWYEVFGYMRTRVVKRTFVFLNIFVAGKSGQNEVNISVNCSGLPMTRTLTKANLTDKTDAQRCTRFLFRAKQKSLVVCLHFWKCNDCNNGIVVLCRNVPESGKWRQWAELWSHVLSFDTCTRGT